MDCMHCGAVDATAEIARKTLESGRQDFGGGFIGDWERSLTVEQCGKCDGFMLLTHSYADWMDPEDVTYEMLYPQARDMSSVPESVKKQYDKARRVRSIDSEFYVLGLRRTLEAVCAEQGVPKGLLVNRLKKLAEDAKLPGAFTDMADYLREVGNVGAHQSDVEVTPADVDAARDFTDAILEYLYVAPARLNLVKTSLSQRQAQAKSQQTS
ncbi:protein of unknown function (DUF4145) [Lentzea aerocolonigenes]|nr:protein of unknown function (DUF4145) [Lentzea aerocolonigenes]